MVLKLAFLSALAVSQPASTQDLQAGGGFASRGLSDCPSDLRYINHLTGWQVRWQQDWDELASASDEDVRLAIARWRNAPRALSRDRQALELGSGARAPRETVERVVDQAEALASRLARSPPTLGRNVATDLRSEWTNLISNDLAPAVAAYAQYLRNSYLPRASRSPGLAAVPEGPECFKAAYRFYSSLDLPVSKVEQTGRRLLRETGASLTELHGLRPNELPKLLARLRAQQDPTFGRERLLSVSRAAAARGTAAAPRLFTRRARTEVVFEPVPSHMEATFPAAAYIGSHGNGPPVALLNMSRPAERQLFAEAIAFHETLPGHHVTEAMNYPLGSAPNSGFLEGWGMYAEQLADELGLYSSTMDRAGMLARRLAAAARPIVEVGLHVRGWSRSQAIDFLHNHSALSSTEVENEVDRMIAGPGQPLSYILGYDEIMAARAQAQRSLAAGFDLRQFHEQILGRGARSLAEMRTDLAQWATATGRGDGRR